MKISHYILIFILTLVLAACKPQISNIGLNKGIEPATDPREQTAEPESGPQKSVDEIASPKSQVLPEEPRMEDTSQSGPEEPDFLDTKVGFASQAPFGVWDEFHEETCEEAAMIMVVNHFLGEEINAHIMEQALLKIDKWHKQNGYKVDLTAREVKENLKNYFGFESELITEVTAARIKKELLAGKLIIVPAAGRELGNPYFTPPGPIYHMLVIRGYDAERGEFITNDPGTKRGEAYRYKYNRLIGAIHDWDHSLAIDGMTDEEIAQGGKIMISVGPK
ncbi:C39 family peptidase [Candidatus Falkowbacteria bacterium]|nr:C39 family peptidase [Candidatus Falkowbacteria bacterium]